MRRAFSTFFAPPFPPKKKEEKRRLLRVEVALDAPLGCFLELLGVELEGGDEAEVGHGVVERLEVAFHDGFDLVVADAGLVGQLPVGVDEGDEAFPAGHDERFGHVGEVVQLVLDLFRIDVLPAGSEDHGLRAAADEDGAVGRDDAQVARTHPAVGEERGLRRLGVLVIAQHDVVSPHEDFAHLPLGVFRVDPRLHPVHDAADGARLEGVPLGVGDQWAAFGHAIAHGVGETDPVEERLDLAVERGAPDDHLADPPAESGQQALGDFPEDKLARERHFQRQLDRCLLQFGENTVADDLLDDQRHGEDERRPDAVESLGDDLGAGRARQEMDVASLVDRVEDLEGQAVHVGHREHADDGVAGMDEGQVVRRELRVAPQASVGDHHAFREAGRPRGVVEDGQLVGLLQVVAEPVGREAFGVFLVEEPVDLVPSLGGVSASAFQHLQAVDQHAEAEVGHLPLVEVLPVRGADEEGLGFRVVDDMVDVIRLEIVQDRDGYRPVGKDGEKRDGPARGVAPDERDLVAPPQACLVEQQVEARDLHRHVLVAERVASIVGEGGLFPMGLNTPFDQSQKAVFPIFRVNLAHVSCF